MRSDYSTKKLGEVCDILDSKRKPVTKKDRESGQYPYYGATGIQDCVSGYIFDEPLVLVGEDGARWEAGANSAFRIDGKCWVNNHAHVLRPHRNEVLDDWLIYFLNSSDLMPYVTGTTVKKLNQERLRSIEIPLPLIAEQRRIVEKIEKQFAKIDEAARLRAESLEATDQLLPAALHEIFSEGKQKGWGEKELGSLCDILDNKRKPVTRRDRKSGPYPYYGATQVQDYVADYIFDEPLVLLGEDGARWGANESSAYKIEGKTWVNNHAHVLRPHRNELLDSWLVYNLNYADLSGYITGTTVKKLNQEKMRSIKVPLPPLAEQKKIVKKLDALSEKVRALRELQLAQAADLKALKQSILHEAFAEGVQ